MTYHDTLHFRSTRNFLLRCFSVVAAVLMNQFSWDACDKLSILRFLFFYSFGGLQILYFDFDFFTLKKNPFNQKKKMVSGNARKQRTSVQHNCNSQKWFWANRHSWKINVGWLQTMFCLEMCLFVRKSKKQKLEYPQALERLAEKRNHLLSDLATAIIATISEQALLPNGSHFVSVSTCSQNSRFIHWHHKGCLYSENI